MGEQRKNGFGVAGFGSGAAGEEAIRGLAEWVGETISAARPRAFGTSAATGPVRGSEVTADASPTIGGGQFVPGIRPLP